MINTRLSATADARSSTIRTWTSRLAGLAVVVTLAACSSGVKLDEVPVKDLNSASGTQGTAGTGADANGVAAVEVPGSNLQQPDAMARTVYFDYDSFEVRAEYAATLEANARYLKANANRKLALEGHTDERGGREYNLALGQKRAEAVRRSMSLLGVSEAQMEPVSFGEEKPAAFGFDEESFAKNRRVELTYR